MKLFSAMLLGVIAIFTAHSAQAESYQFKVHNNSGQKMVKLLVSEDGSQWGEFALSGGVAAGEVGTMEWDESTNDEDCKQKVKAVYADVSESAPATFDFCEEGLELEFE